MKRVLIVALLLLPGCMAQCMRNYDLSKEGVSQTCVNGVVYYQFQSGAFVGYNPDGSLRRCK
jgi:hypothetical protein